MLLSQALMVTENLKKIFSKIKQLSLIYLSILYIASSDLILPVCPRVFVKIPQLFVVVSRFHPLFNMWPVTLDPLINLFSCQDVSPIEGEDGTLGDQLLGKQAVIPR